MIEEVREGGQLLAVVVRTGQASEGTKFITDLHNPLQVGVVVQGTGWRSPPHVHRDTIRTTVGTSEMILVLHGFLEVRIGVARHVKRLGQGDLVVLMPGAPHEVTALMDVRLVEVKNGPYEGRESDKMEWTYESEKERVVAQEDQA